MLYGKHDYDSYLADKFKENNKKNETDIDLLRKEQQALDESAYLVRCESYDYIY